MNKLPTIKTKRLQRAISEYFNFKSYLQHSTGSTIIPINQGEKFDAICNEIFEASNKEKKSCGIVAGTLILVEKFGKTGKKRSGWINSSDRFETASWKMTEDL